MRTHANSIQVQLNDTLFAELQTAAAECSDEEETLAAEKFASEIIESYMASRRLAQADEFIDAAIPLVDGVLARANGENL